MQFNRLRLAGFKSFVEATELHLENGITGIVGPNGCGKSNLVEALRWVMGETSAKRMRGSEMDDVIFGGTSDRPARNIAEVTLVVDNSRRTAPAAFNDFEELEIRRRIERGAGSDYRINGKSVRARDVQLLFQDNGSGAGSASLVGQGRVGALINAKPGERRLLLEEAAGITGLHSRRHEAELRLKAAEGNLERLEDVIQAMQTQLTGLRKQARQAARYREVSERIRRAEAVLLWLRWQSVQARLAEARIGFETNEAQVRELMQGVARATTVRTHAAEAVPPLRQAEAEAAAALHRLTLARDGLAQEADRVRAQEADTRRRLEQILGDIQRETALSGDAEEALARLAEEREALEAAQQDAPEVEAEAREALVVLEEEIAELDTRLQDLTEQAAAEEAQRRSLIRQVEEQRHRLATQSRRLEDLDGQRAALLAEADRGPDPGETELALEQAEAALESVQEDADRAEQARQEAESAQAAAGGALQAQEAGRAKLAAEADGLRSVLAAGGDGQYPPLLDSLTVTPGYETALGAALGDDLEAPLDEAAAVHWRHLPPLADPTALPEGVAALADRVRAPPALARRLGQIGVVADRAEGDRLAPILKRGQQLVACDGGLWRWDGLVVRADAPTAAAIRLQQRNRLADLDEQVMLAEAGVEDAAARRDAAAQALAEARERERAARTAVQAAYAGLSQLRERQAREAQAAAARDSRLTVLADQIAGLTADRDEQQAALESAQHALAALPEGDSRRPEIAGARARIAEKRTEEATRRNAVDGLRREVAQRQQRLTAIAREEHSWSSRAAGAQERLDELQARAAESREALEALAARPEEIAEQREALGEQIDEAASRRSRAADSLAAAESQLAEIEKTLKEAEAALAAAREMRVRQEAEVRAAMTAVDSVRDRISERLETSPERLSQIADLPADDDGPDETALEARLQRLIRERENIGPVNLRAEIEAEELQQQVDGMIAERDDLIAAIARLRQGISNLNKEARDRLLASFEAVDRHFQRLFVKLFGGGRAYLKLTEVEDPLDAGLEVFASPPGKRLQHLSLLSGGEQALTAVSLLFAVFLTNPAPICVLDEVDAPLDDANVDRFCNLLEELTAEGVTRFLVITHHRMTMARVTRLYGVTMAERGVSQLVSVDLEQAAGLRETA